MSTVLLVGDPQERLPLVAPLIAHAERTGEQVWFLGDYLDSFQYETQAHLDALTLVLDAIEAGHARGLLGNHEASYLVLSQRASGYREDIARGLDALGLAERMTRLLESHFWVAEHRILVTHAGVSAQQWQTSGLSGKHRDPGDTIDTVLAAAFCDHHSWFYDVGHARGGSAQCGGPLWCDWSDEFEPVIDVRQVVGHSRSRRTPRHFTEVTIDGLRLSAQGDWNIDCLADYTTVLRLDMETGVMTPVNGERLWWEGIPQNSRSDHEEKKA